MDNNQAFVCLLKNIKPIPNADNIVQADVVLNGVKITQVITGKDTKEDTLIVYFDSNLCLSQKLLEDYPDFGKYLSKNGRIKVIKLKGVISNGLTIEIDKFYRYDSSAKSLLVEGYSFTKIGDTEMCHKYVPLVQVGQNKGKKKGRKGKTFNRVIPEQWHFHIDTPHLTRNAHKLNPEQIISISRKYHGTSAICSRCLTKRPLSLFEKLLQRIGVKIQDTSYEYLYASRTVIKNASINSGFYGMDIWTKVGQENFKDKLHCGETIYYEIVGYILGTSTYIQKNYNYGCKLGEYKIFVYRITMTSPSGNVTELQWQAMKARCSELGVQPVQEYYYGMALLLFPYLDKSEHWNISFIEEIKKMFLEKTATDCYNMPPDEGIVLRVDGNPEVEVYKIKSELFFLSESKANEEGITDIEESVTQNELQ